MFAIIWSFLQKFGTFEIFLQKICSGVHSAVSHTNINFQIYKISNLMDFWWSQTSNTGYLISLFDYQYIYHPSLYEIEVRILIFSTFQLWTRNFIYLEIFNKNRLYTKSHYIRPVFTSGTQTHSHTYTITYIMSILFFFFVVNFQT